MDGSFQGNAMGVFLDGATGMKHGLIRLID